MTQRNLNDEAMAYLRSLPATKRELLVRAFEEAQPALTTALLARQVAQTAALDQEQFDQVETVAASFGGWLVILDPNRMEDDRHVVMNVLGHDKTNEDHDADPEEERALWEHVQRLLKCETSLGITQKAQGVLNDNERVYREARVITEVRPVFPPSLRAPENAVLIHQLRLSYTEQGVVKDVFVALDRNCLLNLYNAIDRAWKKEETLRQQGSYRFLNQG